jgi:hypothetical protein
MGQLVNIGIAPNTTCFAIQNKTHDSQLNGVDIDNVDSNPAQYEDDATLDRH